MSNFGRSFPRALFGIITLLLLLGQGGAAAGAAPAAPATTGRIIYLATDGATIKSIKPDRTDSRTVYTISKARSQTVGNLTADPTGSYILYSIISDINNPVDVYYLLHNGVARKLPAFSQLPRWSPDGKRFVAQVYTGTEAQGKVFIYNVTNNTSLYLPIAGRVDWSPDGARLVYTDGNDVFSYNRASGAVSKLTHLPHQKEVNDWYVLEAHMLPDGKKIVFFGQEYVKNGEPQLGASGNGLQWFWIPSGGGTPQPWLDIEGNSVVAYAASANANKIAYVGNAHSSACAAVQALAVVYADRVPGQVAYLDIPGYNEDAEKYVEVAGLTWSPTGKQLAYGVMPYTCADAGSRPTQTTSVIYVTGAPDRGAGKPAPAVKLANGSFPVWVK